MTKSRNTETAFGRSFCLRLPFLTEPKINPDCRAIGTVLARQKAFGRLALHAELHSAAECFIAQMRIYDLRVRIVCDGHEPNEAEEQRPCGVPIEPVHVISSPKDRREQEGYQNSGSLGETSRASIQYLSRGSGIG
jgi:hypothetical protein